MENAVVIIAIVLVLFLVFTRKNAAVDAVNKALKNATNNAATNAVISNAIINNAVNNAVNNAAITNAVNNAAANTAANNAVINNALNNAAANTQGSDCGGSMESSTYWSPIADKYNLDPSLLHICDDNTGAKTWAYNGALTGIISGRYGDDCPPGKLCAPQALFNAGQMGSHKLVTDNKIGYGDMQMHAVRYAVDNGAF